MKKRIYLLLLSVTVIFFSCKDKTDKFAEQLFTDVEITGALKLCIDSAALHTIDALYNKELGYSYSDSLSRLNLPETAKNVKDTLLIHGFETRINTFNDSLNIAAGRCGEFLMRSFWRPTIDSIKFPVPNAILRGGANAITNFVKQNYQTEFVSVLVNNLLAVQLNTFVISEWNNLQNEYRLITGNYSSIDILTPTAQKMVADFFIKMALREADIRKDPALRGSPNGLFYRVFDF